MVYFFLRSWFSFSSDQPSYETSSSTQSNLIKLFYKTKRYEKYSITVTAFESWNRIEFCLNRGLVLKLLGWRLIIPIAFFAKIIMR